MGSSIPSDWHDLASSVRGILTEGVRGEAVCCAQQGRPPRFMFDDIPKNYRSQTADNERRLAIHAGDKTPPPPELSHPRFTSPAAHA